MPSHPTASTDFPSLDFIERKSLLYRSGLGFHCINHVQGCSHGCRYPCHGYLIAKRYGKVSSYAEWCRPRLVSNALDLLDLELARKRVKPECVHLSLATDPFMVGYPPITEASLALIERINQAGIPCAVLTKGVLPEDLADQRRFLRSNIYGISLVSLDENFRQKFEPGAAPYRQRILALKRLHDLGSKTRVHMEPYPTPNLVQQRIGDILENVSFTDSLFFGGLNYNSCVHEQPSSEAFYAATFGQLRKFCLHHGIRCENA